MKKFSAVALLVFLYTCSFSISATAVQSFLYAEFSGLYKYENDIYSPIEDTAILFAADTFLQQLEREITVRQGSAIAAFNSAPSGERIEVTKTAAELFEIAAIYNKKTNGAFNPAVYPSTVLWGFSPDNEGNYSTPRPSPAEVEIENVAALARAEFLYGGQTAESGNTITLINESDKYYLVKNNDNLMLDFGGIAKGFALDKIKTEILDGIVDIGVASVLSSTLVLGGNIKDGKQNPHTVYIENPRPSVNKKAYAFSVSGISDCSFTTSADTYRSYISRNKLYSHIIDTETGSPCDRGVISVTVFADSGSSAEAYSTAAFALGAKNAVQLFERENLRALIITADYKYYVTGALEVENISQGLFERGDIPPEVVIPSKQERKYLKGDKNNNNLINAAIAVTFSALSIGAILFLVKRSSNGKN